jgi:hypothetical protein
LVLYELALVLLESPDRMMQSVVPVLMHLDPANPQTALSEERKAQLKYRLLNALSGLPSYKTKAEVRGGMDAGASST